MDREGGTGERVGREMLCDLGFFIVCNASTPLMCLWVDSAVVLRVGSFV